MITGADIREYQAANEAERRKIADRLLRENEPLIVRLVKKASRFAPPGTEWNDLMQAGRIAFIKALPGADPERTFSTYFAYWLKNELRRVTERVGEIFRPHRSVMDYKAVQEEQKIRALYNRPATAEELGVSEKKLAIWREQPMRAELSAALELPDVSMNAEETLLDREDRFAALNRINALPEQDREMLKRLRKGESVKVVAKALGMKPAEMRVRLQEIANGRH